MPGPASRSKTTRSRGEGTAARCASGRARARRRTPVELSIAANEVTAFVPPPLPAPGAGARGWHVKVTDREQIDRLARLIDEWPGRSSRRHARTRPLPARRARDRRRTRACGTSSSASSRRKACARARWTPTGAEPLAEARGVRCRRNAGRARLTISSRRFARPSRGCWKPGRRLPRHGADVPGDAAVRARVEFDGPVICYQGAAIVDPTTDEVARSCGLANEIVRELVAMAAGRPHAPAALPKRRVLLRVAQPFFRPVCLAFDARSRSSCRRCARRFAYSPATKAVIVADEPERHNTPRRLGRLRAARTSPAAFPVRRDVRSAAWIRAPHCASWRSGSVWICADGGDRRFLERRAAAASGCHRHRDGIGAAGTPRGERRRRRRSRIGRRRRSD